MTVGFFFAARFHGPNESKLRELQTRPWGEARPPLWEAEE